MIIDGFDKLTLLDYPGHIACIIFTRGCNFACSYCQNSSLINCNKSKGLVDSEDVLKYLNSRKKLIEGIVISGGEPTIQKGLKDFIKKVKSTVNINKDIELVNLLIEHGADVNAKDSSGRSVLGYAKATTFDNTEIINILIQAGAKE